MALQGAREADWSFFQYKCPQTPLFCKNKKILGRFQADSLSSLSNFSPKHIQTPSNTFDYSFFTIISRQCFCTQSSSPWFHTLDLRFRVWIQLFSYNPHNFLFIAFSIFLLFNNMLYCFSQHVFMVFLACFLTYAMAYRFDVVGLAFLDQDMSKFNVCVQIHMILSSFPCLCLDLHAYVFLAMLIFRSTCLCLDLCVYVLHAMLVCLYLCWFLCHVRFYSPFVP